VSVNPEGETKFPYGAGKYQHQLIIVFRLLKMETAVITLGGFFVMED